MSKLLDKIKKNSTIKEASVLSDSKYFNDKETIPTSIPALNIALSGRIDGGFCAGLTQWCGESARMKSIYCLIMAKTYLEKYDDAILLFYDSEFGTPKKYFETLGIDMTRVVHCPLKDIEQLSFDLLKQLEGIDRGDHVFILVDSIGNLASKREIENTLAEKSVEDLTRPKKLKALFRMVTPYLNLNNIPMHVVNHIYKELSMFPKDIVSGGQGAYLSSDNIYIIGKQQEKDGSDLVGFNFVINVEKSRFVRQKSKIPITVTFEEGINKYSGLLDIAEELNFVQKPSNGWFSRVNPDTGELEERKWRRKDTNTKEFWDMLLTSENFKNAVYERYGISSHSIIVDDIADNNEIIEEESGE